MQTALAIVDNQNDALAEARQNVLSITGMTESQWAGYMATVTIELTKLRFAYPTQARSFSTEELNCITAVWLETFIDVDPQTLHEAIMRFIKADRKAFFPSPGQIMGFVEEIEKEKRDLEWRRHSMERTKRYLAKIRQEDDAI